MTVPGWRAVFRGTAAVSAGLVTSDRLRGPGFDRLLPDTYVPAGDGPPGPRLRSLAAYLWAGPGAVLGGYSAATRRPSSWVARARRGTPRPVTQHPVVDDDRRVLWLDLAYPEQRLGLEYDGGDHFATPEAARADARRHTRLVAAGWRVLRYTAEDMRNASDRIVAEVRSALDGAHPRRDAVQRAVTITEAR